MKPYLYTKASYSGCQVAQYAVYTFGAAWGDPGHRQMSTVGPKGPHFMIPLLRSAKKFVAFCFSSLIAPTGQHATLHPSTPSAHVTVADTLSTPRPTRTRRCDVVNWNNDTTKGQEACPYSPDRPPRRNRPDGKSSRRAGLPAARTGSWRRTTERNQGRPGDPSNHRGHRAHRERRTRRVPRDGGSSETRSSSPRPCRTRLGSVRRSVFSLRALPLSGWTRDQFRRPAVDRGIERSRAGMDGCRDPHGILSVISVPTVVGCICMFTCSTMPLLRPPADS